MDTSGRFVLATEDEVFVWTPVVYRGFCCFLFAAVTRFFGTAGRSYFKKIVMRCARSELGRADARRERWC